MCETEDKKSIVSALNALTSMMNEFKASLNAAHDKLNRIGTNTAPPVIAAESTSVPNVKTAAHGGDTETQRSTDVAAISSESSTTPNSKADVLYPGSKFDT